MKVIVGIGNPGSRYEYTRHNVGFSILDEYANKIGVSFSPGKGDYLIAESNTNTFPFFLIKPTSYVNRSGDALSSFIGSYDINVSEILILVDDIHLMPGSIRIRKSGGDGGHNGLKSIIYHLNSDQFPRIRIGVGSMLKNDDLADFVLSEFDLDSKIMLVKTIPFILELIEIFIEFGTQSMLDHYSKNIKIIKNSGETN